jgi:hypothetical protein
VSAILAMSAQGSVSLHIYVSVALIKDLYRPMAALCDNSLHICVLGANL